jgi:peptide/nickel transport system substrate-binding protein
VRLWQAALGSFVALTPNYNTIDPVWRALLRDVRFRRALSLGLNRHDVNQVIFFGLARETANTVLPDSPLYKPEYASAYAKHDRAAANALLDEVGLTQRDWEGFRELPDGRRAELIIETAGESTEETDILELVAHDYHKLGIRVLVHGSQRDVFRRRIMAGQTVLSAGLGLDNALPGPDMSPQSLAPADRGQMQWPRWGEYVESNGTSGEPCDLPAAQELVRLLKAWRQSATTQERADIWRRMLEIHADQVFTIGIVSGTQQPVVVSNRLRNVPEKGQYSFEPGAFFGVYKPDTFWFEGEEQK